MGTTVSRFHSTTTHNRANYDGLLSGLTLAQLWLRRFLLTIRNALPIVMRLVTMGALLFSFMAPRFQHLQRRDKRIVPMRAGCSVLRRDGNQEVISALLVYFMQRRGNMGREILLWLLGVPIPIILLIMLFWS